jgi:hypothetical protein
MQQPRIQAQPTASAQGLAGASATHGARLALASSGRGGPSPRRFRSPGGDTRRPDLQEASNPRKVRRARGERPGRGGVRRDDDPRGGR